MHNRRPRIDACQHAPVRGPTTTPVALSGLSAAGAVFGRMTQRQALYLTAAFTHNCSRGI